MSVGHVPDLSSFFSPLLCVYVLHTEGIDAPSLTSGPEHPLHPSLLYPNYQSVCAQRKENQDER